VNPVLQLKPVIDGVVEKPTVASFALTVDGTLQVIAVQLPVPDIVPPAEGQV
jgi:hypothetical protein